MEGQGQNIWKHANVTEFFMQTEKHQLFSLIKILHSQLILGHAIRTA